MKKLILSLTFCVMLASCGKQAGVSPYQTPPDTRWVEAFFQAYAAAFRSRSSPRLLAKFTIPLTFLTKTGPIVFQDEAHLTANLDALLRRYDEIEAVDWKYTIKEVRTTAPGICQVDVEWQFLNPNHELLFACDTTYFLAMEAKGGIKIMAVIAHNEVERYEQALKRKQGVNATPPRRRACAELIERVPPYWRSSFVICRSDKTMLRRRTARCRHDQLSLR
jgi:hypothetical protein